MSGSSSTLAATPDPEAAVPDAAAGRPAPYVPKLGEELPVFCERCGYSLHGLPQSRCGACTLLHFVCPECNHRQPINTLRPAFQRLLGRVRAAFLVGVVFFKLNWFGWLLLAWFAMGGEWSYSYRYESGPNGGNSYLYARQIDWESMLAFSMFAVPFGLVSRLLLLRWRRGILVGAVLALCVVAAAGAGAIFRGYVDVDRNTRRAALSFDFPFLLVIASASIVLGASLGWPVWVALVRAFLPTRPAHALLDWQRSLSDPAPEGHATRGLDTSNPA